MTMRKWLGEFGRNAGPLGCAVAIVAAVGANGAQFSTVCDCDLERLRTVAALRTDDCWDQIVVYDARTMDVVDQIDLTDRTITTDAPLLEPLRA